MAKNIAILGASGLVGRTMLNVLEERNFPVGELRLLASGKSAGMKLNFRAKKYEVQAVNKNSFKGIDIALFSAGKAVSRKWAAVAANEGCIVIDNSSAWRMEPGIPLIVPEVNAHALNDYRGIIANPNCSTIQLVVVLNEIHKYFGLKRVVVSTYQSISGAGQKGIDKLMGELNNEETRDKHKIAFNAIFHDITHESGHSDEEIKMINETRKIMNLPDLSLSVTCVRLPILGGHGESVNIQTGKPSSVDKIRQVMKDAKGITLIDNPQQDDYPTPAISDGKDEVFVGRIRKDDPVDNGFYLWIVADNVRKGAATNAVQIAELYLD
ncbi:aspartate-semialdehyde dehydrogenase [Bacteroidota bacterium]